MLASPLVGRSAELAVLARALAEAEEGRGGLVLLAGEPGIGKTRLADEVAARAAEQRMRVVWGRCWEAGGAPPYWPWAQAIAALLRDEAPAEVERLLGPRALDVAEIAPAIREILPGLPLRPPLEGSEAKFQLFSAVHALLVATSATRPVLVLLDDLHAADLSSLGVLEFVARQLRGARLLIVGTYRDAEARRAAEIGASLARAAREGHVLDLRRLDRDATAELARRLAGADDATAAAVYAASQGNPLFADEVLRHLASHGVQKEVPLPYGVRDAIRQRLALLGDEARSVLAAASIFGRDFPAAGVVALLDRQAAPVADALALGAEVGTVAPDGAGRHRFSHILVREVLYRDLPASRRAELHRAAAAWLRQGPAPDRLARLSEIALHEREAGDAAGAARAAVEAAEWAMDRQAYEDAEELLVQALAMPGAHTVDAAIRFEILLGLGRARIGAGRGAAGQESCREAVTIARVRGDGTALARAALGYGALVTPGRVDASLVGMLQEALAALAPGEDGLRAAAMGRLAAAMQPAIDPEVPMQLAREAVALARRVGDRRILASVLGAANSTMASHAGVEELAALGSEHEALVADLGDRAQLLRARRRLVFAHLAAGDAASADAVIAAYEACARELGRPLDLWPARIFRSMRAVMSGRFDEADQLIAEAKALAAEAADAEAAVPLAIHTMTRVLTHERPGDVALALAATRPLFQASPMLAMNFAMLEGYAAAVAGDLATARACYASLEPEWSHLTGRIETLGAGEILAAVGTDEQVAACYARHADTTVRVPAVPYSMSANGVVARMLALLAARLGRWDDAERHFADGIALCDRLGMRPHAARLRFDRAEARLSRGCSEDRERARAGLEEALGEARALEMSGLVARAEARLVELGAAPSADVAGGPSAAALELVSEGEVWTVRFGAASFRLRDSKGVRMLAELVARPGDEIHALELMGSSVDACDAGDAGELLDAEAVADYRRRIDDLDEEIAEAERFADAPRAARRRAEREALAAEISRAVGLGGRGRRAASSAERARSAVRRRLKDAIDRMAEQCPELGEHLTRALRTGTFCTYGPAGSRPR